MYGNRFEVRLKPNLKSLQANLKSSEMNSKIHENRFEVRLKPNFKSLQANLKSTEIQRKNIEERFDARLNQKPLGNTSMRPLGGISSRTDQTGNLFS